MVDFVLNEDDLGKPSSPVGLLDMWSCCPKVSIFFHEKKKKSLVWMVSCVSCWMLFEASLHPSQKRSKRIVTPFITLRCKSRDIASLPKLSHI